jgi:ferredoxin
MIRIQHLSDVVSWRLCLGCGACAYACPEGRVRLVDLLEEGIRPVVGAADCGSCRQSLDVCPVVQSDFRNAGPDASRGGVFLERAGQLRSGVFNREHPRVYLCTGGSIVDAACDVAGAR